VPPAKRKRQPAAPPPEPAKPPTRRRRKATPAPRGRPSVLGYAPEVGDAIVKSVLAGVPVAIAARAAGVEPSTVHSWIQRGANGTARDRVFADFAAAIADARAKAAVSNIVELRAASRGGQVIASTTEVVETVNADGEIVERRTITRETRQRPDWRGNAFWLARQYPDDFGQVERHELTGKEGGPVILALGELYAKDPKARALGLQLADRAIESGALDGDTIDGEWTPVT
jgi:hypothetical protein